MGGQKYEIVCWQRKRGEVKTIRGQKKFPIRGILSIQYRQKVYFEAYNLYHSMSNSLKNFRPGRSVTFSYANQYR
jgi:hypothetical protein